MFLYCCMFHIVRIVIHIYCCMFHIVWFVIYIIVVSHCVVCCIHVLFTLSINLVDLEIITRYLGKKLEKGPQFRGP